MRFESFYSSSMGNLYCVTAANGRRLLIECGVTWKKLVKALNHDLHNIEGCLLTHEHKDHSKAVEDVLTAGIDVYASAETLKSLGCADSRKANVIEDKHSFCIGGTFRCIPFIVSHYPNSPIIGHDVHCMGFIVTDVPADENLLFVTDTSCIKARFATEYNIIAICCNHDSALLRARVESGDMNRFLGDRLLECHMNADTTKDYLRKYCCTDKLTEIWLLHLSQSNIDAEKVRADIESEFFTKTLVAGKE